MLCLIFIIAVISSCSDVKQPSDAEVEKAYASAYEAMIQWFELDSMPLENYDVWTDIDGIHYFKVSHPAIKTLQDLKEYLQTLFTDSIVNDLLSRNYYKDIDGSLYAAAASGATNPSKGAETHEIIRENSKKIIYRVTVEDIDNADNFAVIGHTVHDMVYEYINGKWVFSSFERVR